MFRTTIIVSLLCIATAAPDIDTEPEPTTDEDRIVGGRAASISDFPYQCSLQNFGVHFCGGSIISRTRILTAAHCLNKDFKNHKTTPYFKVRCGSTTWVEGGQVRNVIAMKVHDKYNPKTKQFDAALLKLGSPLTYNAEVQPIQLADGIPADGKSGIITGWGLLVEKGITIPEDLREAEVTSISRKKCSQPPYDYDDDEILYSMICAQSYGKDGCQGDSGGPLVSKATGKLWGIVSWGHGCGREEYPGVYCTIASIQPWIDANMDTF